MNSSDCSSRIAALRKQIERDSALGVHEYERHLRQAFDILNEIANSGAVSPSALQQIPKVKTSLREFYNMQSTRGWAQRFALADLKALEDLCLSESCPREDSIAA